MSDTDNRSSGDPRAESHDPWTQGQQKPVSSGSADQSSGNAGVKNESWERDVVNRLAFAALNEQRRSRRWGLFFKTLTFVYLFALLFYLPAQWGGGKITVGPHTALVDIEGVIAGDAWASADNIVGGLRAAFEDHNSKGVILRINSPGGSPVQAGYVYDEIRRLRNQYPEKKVYAVITDMCASGGYYIAAAADEIYADKASIVGSIGVISESFGFVGTLEKLGVERRVFTAGENKAVLDPFSPLKSSDVDHLQQLLNEVHQQFITAVKEGRGERLREDPKIFSGLFWSGEGSVELGLVDGLGNSSYVARELVGAQEIVDYSARLTYFDRFAERFGVAMAKVLSQGAGLQSWGLR